MNSPEPLIIVVVVTIRDVGGIIDAGCTTQCRRAHNFFMVQITQVLWQRELHERAMGQSVEACHEENLLFVISGLG